MGTRILSQGTVHLHGIDWHISNKVEGQDEKEFDALVIADRFMAGFQRYRKDSTMFKEREMDQKKF